MTCTGCKKRARWRETGDALVAAMRREGWFVWDNRAPIQFHGTVLCPACRDPRIEAEAGPPTEAA